MNPDAVPFQPWARALFDQRKDGSHSREDPDANCLPQGVPKANAVAYPWKMIQTPGSIVIVYEAFNLWRQIFMDGRELSADANPTWQGYSTGKWDGDTLVVDTRGFNGKAWLDQVGRPTTDALHVTERFRRKDFGHMEIQITIDDPKAYTQAMDRDRGSQSGPGHGSDGIHLQREQPRPGALAREDPGIHTGVEQRADTPLTLSRLPLGGLEQPDFIAEMLTVGRDQLAGIR